MKEQIYTIPINEAFDKALASESCVCPVCLMYSMLEKNAIDSILGAAMMEPDVRIETNRLGFCHRHFEMMFNAKNRLGLALILESHLDAVEKDVIKGKNLLDMTGEQERRRLGQLEESCYVCSHIGDTLFRMMKNIVFLWETEDEFKEKFASQHCFCLPHYKMLLEYGKSGLDKKNFASFFDMISKTEKKYISELGDDISWFCKKFDYRYENEPWYNAKDSVARAIEFLSGGADMNKK